MTTGNPTLDWILLAAIFLVLLYWLRAWWLAWEGIRFFLSKLLVAGAVFLALVVYLQRSQPWTLQQDEIPAGVAAVAVFLLLPRRRSRYISQDVRREVVARDLKGQKFDGKRHHIDHVWPHSKGGSNTADNLRVVDKSRNLRKGAKRPRFWDMW
jgi:hypothetical protein